MKYLHIFVLLLLCASNAHPCSCIPISEVPSEAVKESAEKARLIFSGTVVSQRMLPGDSETQESHLSVDRVWKGPKLDSATMRIDLQCCVCGVILPIGEPLLVFAYQREDGYLSTSICSLSMKLSEASDHVAALDELYGDKSQKTPNE